MIDLKIRYLGPGSPMTLTQGKVYEVEAIEGDFYRIVDDTGEDYLYFKDEFEVVEE